MESFIWYHMIHHLFILLISLPTIVCYSINEIITGKKITLISANRLHLLPMQITLGQYQSTKSYNYVH